MKARSSVTLLLLVVVLVHSVSGPGCANIVPPQGGPKDSLPPLLIKSSPADSSRNFTGNRIVFSFNEFVDIQNVQENLMVSPIPGNLPVVDVKLNTITVRLKDSLESNTTYSLNFGNAIKDYNEGNVLKGFTYTFSTGNYIDSLELKGSVTLAETGKIDTTLIVMLHTSSEDSAVIKDKPRYLARLDSRGNFHFKNLPAKTFYLYALKDDGGTRRYFKDDQLFAFADEAIRLSTGTDPVKLYAYAVKQTPAGSGTTANPGNRINLGGAVVEKGSDKRLRYQTSVSNKQQDILTPLVITFELPLLRFDSTKIRLFTDSTFTPDTAHIFEMDSTRKKLMLNHTWKPGTSYHVILDQDFAADTAGRKLLKTDTLSFTTKKTADYGGVKLRFRNLDMSKNPVLLFVSGNAITKSVRMTSPEFSQSLFVPGEYELRILFDENKNGEWDPGNFFGGRRQPEITRQVERKITIRANWQNEFDIDAPAPR